VSDDLANYLDSIDSRLVGYLNTHRDVPPDAVRHVQCYAVAMLQDLIVPEVVHEDWPDFYPLVVAILLAYGSPRLGRLARHSALFEGGADDPLTDAGRMFLTTLLAELHVLVSRRETR